jgi:hypothetical protein
MVWALSAVSVVSQQVRAPAGFDFSGREEGGLKSGETLLYLN